MDMFSPYSKPNLCFIDYPSKFQTVKNTEGLSADNSIACKVIFSEYGQPKKIISGAVGHFVSKIQGILQEFKQQTLEGSTHHIRAISQGFTI